MKRRLDRRFAEVETEIAMNETLNAEFAPRRPKRLKPTRWDFGGLARENDYINELARRAFDPLNGFAECPKMGRRRDEPCVPAIQVPHRIGPVIEARRRNVEPPRYRAKEPVYDSLTIIPDTTSYSRTRTPSVTLSRSSGTNLDETIDQFIDKIDEFQRW